MCKVQCPSFSSVTALLHPHDVVIDQSMRITTLFTRLSATIVALKVENYHISSFPTRCSPTPLPDLTLAQHSWNCVKNSIFWHPIMKFPETSLWKCLSANETLTRNGTLHWHVMNLNVFHSIFTMITRGTIIIELNVYCRVLVLATWPWDQEWCAEQSEGWPQISLLPMTAMTHMWPGDPVPMPTPHGHGNCYGTYYWLTLL